MKFSKINNAWPYVFLFTTSILLYNVFSYRCDYDLFEITEYSICSKVDIGKAFIIFVIVFLAVSLFFSFKNISCSLETYNKEKRLVCGANVKNTISILIIVAGLLLLALSAAAYFFNMSICGKSYDELKKIKLMQLKNYVTNSYENSEYYPYYFGKKKYPDSFDDMVKNGTMSENEARYFQDGGFELKKTNGDDKYYVEAKFYIKEKRFPCEDIKKVSKVYYCNQDNCVMN